MAEQAFYPVVALYYFYKVSRVCHELVLDSRASVNVACLFILVQPLCLLLGEYTGMLAYLGAAVASYILLPRAAHEHAKSRPKGEKKPKKEKKVVTEKGEQDAKED